MDKKRTKRFTYPKNPTPHLQIKGLPDPAVELAKVSTHLLKVGLTTMKRPFYRYRRNR